MWLSMIAINFRKERRKVEGNNGNLVGILFIAGGQLTHTAISNVL